MRKSVRFAEFVVLSFVLGRCMPDLDALQAGSEGGSTSCTDGECTGGTSGSGGAESTGGKGGAATTGGKGGGTSGSTGTGGNKSSGGSTSPGGTHGEDAGAGGDGGTPTTTGGTAGSGGEGASTPTEGGAGGSEVVGGAGGGGTVGPCMTTFAGDILYAFENATLAGPKLPGAWMPYPEGTPTPAGSTTTWSSSEGHSCPGALKLTAPFESYGTQPSSNGPQRVMAVSNFTDNWTGYSMMHGWLKVEAPDAASLTHLNGVQLSVSSGTGYSTFRGSFVSAPLFADGEWHEITVPLNATAAGENNGFVPDTVLQIGIQIVLAASAPGAGPEAPVTTTVYADDIWLE